MVKIGEIGIFEYGIPLMPSQEARSSFHGERAFLLFEAVMYEEIY